MLFFLVNFRVTLFHRSTWEWDFLMHCSPKTHGVWMKINQGSLDYPFPRGSFPVQMHGHLRNFPCLLCTLFGLVISWPLKHTPVKRGGYIPTTKNTRRWMSATPSCCRPCRKLRTCWPKLMRCRWRASPVTGEVGWCRGRGYVVRFGENHMETKRLGCFFVDLSETQRSVGCFCFFFRWKTEGFFLWLIWCVFCLLASGCFLELKVLKVFGGKCLRPGPGGVLDGFENSRKMSLEKCRKNVMISGTVGWLRWWKCIWCGGGSVSMSMAEILYQLWCLKTAGNNWECIKPCK